MSPTVSTSFSLEQVRSDITEELPTDMKRRSLKPIEACDMGETCDTSETSESGKTTDESFTDVDCKKAYRSESFDEIEDEAKMLNPQVPRIYRTCCVKSIPPNT